MASKEKAYEIDGISKICLISLLLLAPYFTNCKSNLSRNSHEKHSNNIDISDNDEEMNEYETEISKRSFPCTMPSYINDERITKNKYIYKMTCCLNIISNNQANPIWGNLIIILIKEEQVNKIKFDLNINRYTDIPVYTYCRGIWVSKIKIKHLTTEHKNIDLIYPLSDDNFIKIYELYDY